MSRPTGRRPTGSRLSRRPACRANTASARSAGCGGKRASISSSRRCCRLLPKYPDFTAVVIGFVSVDNRLFVERLKQRIAAAGLSERIRFLGELPIEEVPLWYQRISIYVFASRVEGFGLTMLEAMAAGDAVVATRAGAAETVIADGETGVLAPIDDVDGLVAALEPLMREPGAHRGDGDAGASAGREGLQPRPGSRRDRRRLSPAVGGRSAPLSGLPVSQGHRHRGLQRSRDLRRKIAICRYAIRRGSRAVSDQAPSPYGRAANTATIAGVRMTSQSLFERLKASFLGSAGDVVFGMEDGTVSIFGLVFGVAATTDQRSTVLIAGASGAVAAAVSMMAGTYLDVETRMDEAKPRRR